MKFIIKHEIPGRIRIHIEQKQMSYQEADTLLYYLNTLEYVTQAKVYRRTADACVCFSGKRELLIQALRKFRYTSVKVPDEVLENSGRQLNDTYQEKLMGQVFFHYAGKILLPYPVRKAVVLWKAVHYLKEGWKSFARKKLEVAVLDASAIGISVLRGDFKTAASIMFLLGVGETLEEWTHKKSVGDLARSMSLNVSKVWLKSGEQEVLVDSGKITEGDTIIVHMGTVIPFDGIVSEGEGLVNQSSLTGEPLPTLKTAGGYVYAGSVLEEGELTFIVKKAGGSSRYESRTAGRSISAGNLRRNSSYMALYTKYHESVSGAYGGFFLCLKTNNADCGTVCNSSGRFLWYYSKGRQIFRIRCRGRNNCAG